MFWQCISLASILYTTALSPSGPVQRNPVFSGKVIEVMEGDLFKVRTKDWGDYTVKLWGVDAPEMDRPFGKAAKDHLKSVILNKSLTVNVFGQENGAKGLQIGWVWIGDPRDFSSANELMVTAGLAWPEPITSNGEIKSTVDLLRKAGEEARKAKSGLWSKPNPISPWEWKKRGK